jgi:hypothetical protein
MKYKLLLAGLVLSTNSFADVPTMKEECLAAQAAICKVNNIEIHVNTVCPENTITVKPLGNENCEDKNVQQKVIENQSLKQKSSPQISKTVEKDANKEWNKDSWIFVSIIVGLMFLSLLTLVFIILALKNNPKNWKFNFGFIGGSMIIDFLITRNIVVSVFNKYNHDTVAPFLIASGYSIVSFIGIGFICSLLFLIISKMIKK